MLRSLYSGVSGMRNQQTKLDVITNNIANVNTPAFKSNRARFQDALSQTLKSASKPTENGRGGINPTQIGLGMELAGIDTMTNQGIPQTTNRPYDCAINGDGYFILSPDNGTTQIYSRDGAFTLDSDFNLIGSNGYGVMGYKPEDVVKVSVAKSAAGQTFDWTADKNATKLASDCSIVINGETILLKQNDTISTVLTKITDSKAGVKAEQDSVKGLVLTSYTGSLKVESGSGDLSGIEFNRAASSAPEGIGVVLKEKTSAIDWSKVKSDTTVPSASPTSVVSINGIKFTFQTSGTENKATHTYNVSTMKDIANSINDAGVGVKAYFSDKGGLILSPDNKNGCTFVKIDPDASTPGIFKDVNLDISGIQLKQLAIPESRNFYHPDGKISNFSISADGTVLGMYNDGTITALGVLALAKFANPAGLMKIGGNSYTISNNSGDATIGTGASGSRGDILQNTLEMSNVDLANEFTDMIQTSRAYQANSRSITTSDEMLQELLNLKR